MDDLDKELNNYIMRCREWYGWHFPEMGKVITDNLAYVRTVQKMGMRVNCSKTDLSDILPEEVEVAVKARNIFQSFQTVFVALPWGLVFFSKQENGSFVD